MRPLVRDGGTAMKSDVPLKLCAPPILPVGMPAGPDAETLVPSFALAVESAIVVPAVSSRCQTA